MSGRAAAAAVAGTAPAAADLAEIVADARGVLAKLRTMGSAWEREVRIVARLVAAVATPPAAQSAPPAPPVRCTWRLCPAPDDAKGCLATWSPRRRS